MPLAVGSRLGPYDNLAPLGAGGMGEVYRAKDTKLGRDVALKILPASFTNDLERVARFRREAQVLASLNHPHIGQIYGLEEANGTQVLVLELVDGESLDKRIAHGPIPVDEALDIAKQIAEALEAAHEKGIIHRDLKPANIALTKDGTVKVLDFGLAKAAESTSGSVDAMNSPTITSPAMMTGVGVILGTAAYMSPEQAKGRPADKRSDVWAFGCVLYEMLSEKRAFAGEDVSDTLAAVLRGDPDWTALPATTPAPIRRLLRRCLEKDRKKRLADAADAGLEINEALTGTLDTVTPSASTVVMAQPRWRRAMPIAVGVLLAGAVIGAAMWSVRPPTPSPPIITRFAITLPAGQQLTIDGRDHIVAISPDGTQMVYVANERLYLRSSADLEARPIAASDLSGALPADPIFSPDGRSIAFWAARDRTLRRVAVSGGAVTTICPIAAPLGMSWGANGILFSQYGEGIMRVSPNGGKPELLVSTKDNELTSGPQMLPGSQALLYTLADGTTGLAAWDKAHVIVQLLKSGERKIVVDGGSGARYIPTGHLVYAVGGTLFAVPFDVKRLEVTGGPVPVVEGVRREPVTGTAQFSFADAGSLLYLPGPVSTSADQRDLALLDRKGGTERLKIAPGSYEHPRISPDGSWLAFDTDDGKEASVWIYELSGASSARRLTFGGNNRFPIWAADGQWVAFQSDREGDLGIFWQRADGSGTAQRLTKAEQGTSHVPESWWPKGDRFSYSVVRGAGASLWIFSVQDKKAEPFDDARSANLLDSVFSPDGQWVAYTVRGADAGVAAVYVQPFPATGALYQISKNERGHHPLWSPDGKALFYFPGADRLVAVTVIARPNFTFGNPTPVPGGFPANATPRSPRNHDITPDGRFITVVDSGQNESSVPAAQQIQVVEHWFEELKARVPTK
jgi:serine/threonine-protein kinase